MKPARVVLALAFAIALGVELYVPLRAPDEATVEDYRAALAGIERAGAKVIVQPAWRTDVAKALAANVALGRGSEARVPRTLVVRDKAWPIPVTWLDGARVLRDEGAVEVLLLGNPSAGYRLDDALKDARVHVVTKEKRTVTCRYDTAQDRHICPGLPEWMWVGDYQMTSGGDTRSCLWSHPTTKGKVVTTFAKSVLGSRLTFSHAFTDRAARGGAPVIASVFVDDVRLAKIKLGRGAGFRSREFDIKESDKEREVRVEVKTEDAGARHYCFSIEVSP